MAIDPRISLAVNPITDITKQFGDILKNLQAQENLRFQRQVNPLRAQIFDIQAQEAQANLPVNLAQAELASSPENILSQEMDIAEKIKLSGAQRLKPFLDSNDISGANAELSTAISKLTSAGVDPSLIQPLVTAQQTLNSENGLATLKTQTDSFLQLSGGIPKVQQKSVSQIEYENLLKDAQGDPSDTRTKAARIKLRLDPGATGSAAITTAQDPELTTKVAESQAEIEGAKKQATEEIVTTETGKRGAIAKALNFAEDTVSKLGSTKSLIDNYKAAIEQLDAGAETGVVYSMFPSFDVNNLILDNIASQAGFDLAKSSGGIITEADMEWGMRTAIPQGLQPAALKEFLTKKVAAQEKIINHINEVATFLGGGDKTLQDWYNLQKNKGKASKLSNEELIGSF